MGNSSGHVNSWKTREIVQCGGPDHDTPYSFNLPAGRPVPNPLCVPATPPDALSKSISALARRGIRTGISILGGGGGDNVPGIPYRSQLRALTLLAETAFDNFLVQLRAAATVLHDWGITHFDIDFEGGIAQDLNASRLPQVFDALRFHDSLISLTTESYSLDALSSVLKSAGQRPDLIQLMMADYSETLSQGVQIAKGIENETGYPISNFRFGIKPQCGVTVGTRAYLEGALPSLVQSGAGIMLWNLGRDYPCDSDGDCSAGCAKNSNVGQQAFSNSYPLGFSCAISKAFDDSSSSRSDIV